MEVTDLAAQFVRRLEDLIHGDSVACPPGHDPHFCHKDTVLGVVGEATARKCVTSRRGGASRDAIVALCSMTISLLALLPG
jgi:hypothetical protein